MDTTFNSNDLDLLVSGDDINGLTIYGGKLASKSRTLIDRSLGRVGEGYAIIDSINLTINDFRELMIGFDYGVSRKGTFLSKIPVVGFLFERDEDEDYARAEAERESIEVFSNLLEPSEDVINRVIQGADEIIELINSEIEELNRIMVLLSDAISGFEVPVSNGEGDLGSEVTYMVAQKQVDLIRRTITSLNKSSQILDVFKTLAEKTNENSKKCLELIQEKTINRGGV